MRDTFIEPLLHPFSTASNPPTPHPDYDEFPRAESPVDSVELDQLPIAARFMSPTGFRPESPTTPTPVIDGESMDTDEEDENDDRLGKGYSRRETANQREAAKHNHPRSPYRGSRVGGKALPFPSRSHHSLPPPPRVNPSSSTQSLGRQSIVYEHERERKHSQGQSLGADRRATPTPSSRVLRKFKKSITKAESLPPNAVAPHQLPEDLRICLSAIENGILDGHARLSEGLRKRYDEQYPLVRSLADVFVSNVYPPTLLYLIVVLNLTFSSLKFSMGMLHMSFTWNVRWNK